MHITKLRAIKNIVINEIEHLNSLILVTRSMDQGALFLAHYRKELKKAIRAHNNIVDEILSKGSNWDSYWVESK